MAHNARTFAALSAEQIGEDGKQWIEVMPTADKARNGPFYFSVDRDDLEVYAASIREAADTLSLDYDHSFAARKDSRAAGWFTGQAEVRDGSDGPRLWAEVQWTPAGIESLRSREYRFVSAEFEFKQRERRTGLMTKAKRILAATLTNRPFFSQLAPVANEDTYLIDNEKLEAVHAAYSEGLAELILAGAQTHESPQVRDLARALIETTPPKENPMDLKVIASELGLAEDADEETILAAVKEAKEKAEKAPDADEVEQLKATATEAEKLRGRLDTLEAERLQEKKELLFAEAVRAGKLVPAQRDTLVGTGGQDKPGLTFDALKALVESTPEHSFRVQAVGSPGAPVEGDEPQGDKAEFESAQADGVDEESLKVHAAAVKILADQGKHEGDYTAAEYRRAVAQAQSDSKTATG